MIASILSANMECFSKEQKWTRSEEEYITYVTINIMKASYEEAILIEKDHCGDVYLVDQLYQFVQTVTPAVL